MPVYNGGLDLLRSVRSILNQTYTEFEFLIINDGSSDESESILNNINDPRVKIIHQENKGLAATLNLGLSIAQGYYIARQDQDDISFPERLEKQIIYMESHAECALVGTSAEIWVGDKKTERAHDHPTEHFHICFDLLFNNPFVHSSVMFRKDAVLAIGGYTTDPMRQPPEDYELWSRMVRQYKVANLAERLLIYREVPQSMSRSGVNLFLEKLVTISAENLAFFNGLERPNKYCLDVAALTHSAHHRLSKKPNLKKMSQLIMKAAMINSKENTRSNILDLAEQRIHNLRHQYFLHRTHTQYIKNILSMVLNKLRRFRHRYSI